MAELKTMQNGASVEAFIEGVADPAIQADFRALLTTMAKVTKAPARM